MMRGRRIVGPEAAEGKKRCGPFADILDIVADQRQNSLALWMGMYCRHPQKCMDVGTEQEKAVARIWWKTDPCKRGKTAMHG